nr:MAG TPA: tail fiber protein [Caudoviricetes sp.]
MAKERKASVIYDGNASQLVYAFPFDYLRKKFVKVEDIYTNITELTIGVDYTVEDKQVRLVKAIPLEHSVKIYRETTTDPLVEWQDASVLRSADLSLQEVQLLHLAEETADKVFDSGMSTAYGNPNCWDGQYKRIINALDPIEDGDVVTLRYIKANQSSLLNALKAEGAKQNASIVATGDNQNKRLTTTGDSYVSTMTTLKDTATTKASESANSAELSKKWAMSDTSPDGVTGNKSSKTWAGEAKTSASNANASASSSQSSANASSASATQSANSASASKSSATASASSASASASLASAASTSAFNAKTSETNAAASAKAAKQSEENAKTWDPTQYVQSVTEANGKITVTTGGGDSNIINLIDTFYPIGTIYVSADKNKTKADFPFMKYGTWEEVPANLCLQTGSASEAGTQRSAGLPNITGEIAPKNYQCTGGPTGAFSDNTKTANESFGHFDGKVRSGFSFDASLSNPIYGASDTVQPPAYMVRAWVRTA